MPKEATKTARAYEWFLRKNQDWFVKILTQNKPPDIDQKLLTKQLDWWHVKMVRAAKQVCGVVVKQSLCFRSVRRTHANEWHFYNMKCEALDFQAIPNPLQHASERTIEHYLDKMANPGLKVRDVLARTDQAKITTLGPYMDYHWTPPGIDDIRVSGMVGAIKQMMV